MAESEGERGRAAPSRGGTRGRGAQPHAGARPRVPAGNGGSLRRAPHAPQGQRPPRGEPQRGGAHAQAPQGQSDAAGRGRRVATGETRGPEPPPEQSEWGAERGRTPRVAQGRASERSERANLPEHIDTELLCTPITPLTGYRIGHLWECPRPIFSPACMNELFIGWALRISQQWG